MKRGFKDFIVKFFFCVFVLAIPFILLVGVLFLSMSLTGQSEGWSALISILSVALYYLILSRFKERLSKKFSFTIDSK